MPYVPPHLRTKSYYEETPALPKIATTAAEAQAMSKAVMAAPKSASGVLSNMLSAPAPKLAGKVSQKAVGPKKKGTHVVSVTPIIPAPQPLGNLHAAKPQIVSATSTPVAAGSFSGLIPSPTGNPHFSTQGASAPKPAKPAPRKKVAKPAPETLLRPSVINASQMVVVTQDVSSMPVLTINTPAFDAAMDDILRTLFEENMHNVKRTALANVGDFSRRANGSYKNERLESRYQGFKLQKLEEHAGKASDEYEKILRSRFQRAMYGVKRIASAAPLNFTQRTNGSYVNERLESRFQGYLMASVNDFGLNVLRKIADNRVTALKAIR